MMRKSVLVFMSIASVVVFAGCVHAGMSKEKEALIYELLHVSNAIETKDVIDDHVRNAIKKQMKAANPDMPKAVFNIVDEEFSALQARLKDNQEVEKIAAKVYSKHYTTSELEELIAFYRTPTGQKMARLGPQVTKDVMRELQPKLKDYVEEFTTHVQTRMITYMLEQQKKK